MGKKRKSRGRSKGKKGRGKMIQCAGCGQLVPRDKAKCISRWVSVVDSRIAKELKKQGAYLPRRRVTRCFCVSCSIHRHLFSPRAQEERQKEQKEELDRRIKKKVNVEIKKKTPRHGSYGDSRIPRRHRKEPI